MAYIDNEDLIDRVGSTAAIQLADDDGNGIADSDVLDEIRLAAEGEVNAFLARRYAVPVTNEDVLDLLASLSLDLAEERLRGRRPPIPPDHVKRIALSRKLLQQISEGVLSLPSATEVAASSSNGIVADSSGETRLLTRDELSNW